MPEPHDGCMQRAGREKTASGKTAAGVSLYLMEELGDARLHCAQLTHYIDLARQIIEKSKAKDHIYEVAGHLLQAIPEHLFKLEKSLQAVALAADRMDYEQIKQELKPDKVEELERVLKEVRIRTVPHRSEPSMGPPMNPTQAAEELQKIAAEIRTTGKIPAQAVLSLVTALEGQERTASEVVGTADLLDEVGKSLVRPSKTSPSRVQLAATLRKVLADSITAADFTSIRAAWIAGTKEATTSTNKEQLGREADPTIHTAKGDIAEGIAGLDRFRPSMLGGPWGILSKMQDALWGLVYWSAVKNTLANGPSIRLAEGQEQQQEQGQPVAPAPMANGLAISPQEQEARRSRFEKGQPADPTENMTPEQKKDWKVKNEEHGDKFKEARRDDWILSPEEFIRVAVMWKLLTHQEATTSAVKEAAREAAEELRDYWPEYAGFGSSDRTHVVYDFLRSAKIPVDFRNGKLTRIDEEEEAKKKTAIQRSPDQFISFLDRMVGGVEEAAKQMRHSLTVYKQDTGKNAPQLGNFYREVASLQGQMRVLERSMPKDIVFASRKPSTISNVKPIDWKVARLHK